MTTAPVRQYELVIDKSGSMGTAFGKWPSRWAAVQETTAALANKMHALDPDGITVSVFSSAFKTYTNVTPDKVDSIFKENEPAGSTDLAGILASRLKAWAEAKREPTTIVVITDGEPDNRAAVAKVIVEATKQMEADPELGISFFQIGNDPAASAFLKYLDDDLVAKLGAKFDVVDTMTFDAIEKEGKTLTDLLIGAIED